MSHPLKALPLDRGETPRPGTDQLPLSALPTPVVTVDDTAVAHNIDAMAAWCAERELLLAPHGKTTMSRQLWERQLAAGAWGITVATPWQLAVALDWGVPRVMLANALVQPAALAAIARQLDDAAPDAAQEVFVWADSPRTAEIMAEGPAPRGGWNVLVELGAPGGRTGARGRPAALEVARAVAGASGLRLAGVAGYEGALAHTGAADALALVRGYLDDLVALHHELADAGLYDGSRPAVVTAGGSAYFDVVAAAFAPLVGAGAEPVLRSGAYVTHDDGFYRGITPASRGAGPEFRAAIHGWATVVSRPEPGLLLVDGGKRDFPFDEGLPVTQGVRRAGAAETEPWGAGEVIAMNDQHSFIRIPEQSDIRIGDVIRLGLSHPCTTFDKWRALPLLDDLALPQPHVVDYLHTHFG
jgi:D-serine deaminase-like pyridoxal phosphate-dependent protein